MPEYSSFCYWRQPIPDINLDELLWSSSHGYPGIHIHVTGLRTWMHLQETHGLEPQLPFIVLWHTQLYNESDTETGLWPQKKKTQKKLANCNYPLQTSRSHLQNRKSWRIIAEKSEKALCSSHHRAGIKLGDASLFSVVSSRQDGLLCRSGDRLKPPHEALALSTRVSSVQKRKVFMNHIFGFSEQDKKWKNAQSSFKTG